MKILLASKNKGKQREVKELLGKLKLELVFPDELSELDNFDPQETGSNFKENALLKAKAYAQQTGLASIADDSGIEIDAMNGLPGIHSNRWFAGSDDERNQEVLRRLETAKSRTARYITVVCYYNPHSEEYALFRETQEGEIARKIYPGAGFAYDRIFIPQGQKQTYSVLGDEFKNKTSQRARALRQLAEYLKQLLALEE